MDGTGTLFGRFINALPAGLEAQVIEYSREVEQSYDQLLEHVRARLPTEPFVLVAESFSGPLAIRLAAEPPVGLKAVALVATFHRRPVGRGLAALRPFVRAPMFEFFTPDFVIRRLMEGADDGLIRSLRAAVSSVRSGVLAKRVRESIAVDVTTDANRAKVPTLYLGAHEDRLLRSGLATEFRALNPALVVTGLEGPHLLLQVKPSESAAVIARFSMNL